MSGRTPLFQIVEQREWFRSHWSKKARETAYCLARRHVRIFRDQLGREPLLSDFTVEHLTPLVERLCRDVWILGLIYRFAVQRGLAKPLDFRITRTGLELVRKRKAGTLRHYFETRCVPELVKVMSARKVREHRHAVADFDRFRGCDSMLSGIKPEDVEAFHEWLINKRGHSPGDARGMRQKLRRILRRIYPDEFADFKPQSMPLEEGTLIRLFEQIYLLERPLARKPASKVRWTINHFSAWLGHVATLDDLKAELVNEFIRDKLLTVLPRTVKNHRANLLALWRMAYEHSLLPELPRRIRPVKVPRKIPEAWTIAEVGRLYAAASQFEGEFMRKPGIKRAAFFRALIGVLWDTGLRRGDVMALRRSQVLPDNTIVVVMQKTGCEHRCRISDQTARDVAELMQPGDGLLFQLGCHKEFAKYWRKLRAGAGLTDKPGACQRLRRSAASYVEQEHPGAAGAFLGHLTPGLAAKHYIDPRIINRRPLAPPSLGAG